MDNLKIKKYKPLSDIEVELNKVTLRAVQFYKKHNFFVENIEHNGEFYDFITTPEMIIEWVQILFKLKEDQIEKVKSNILDVNFEEVFEAHTDFFIKLNPPLKKAIASVENLSSLIPEKILP